MAQPSPPGRPATRREAEEEEAIGGQSGGRQRGRHGRGARDRNHRKAGVVHRAHHGPARIGDARRARVAHQRTPLSLVEAAEDLLHPGRFVVGV